MLEAIEVIIARKSNLSKYGFDFKDTQYVFEGTTLTFEDIRFNYGEQRFIIIGMLNAFIINIAHTEKNEIFRIISMRKAIMNEQKIYYQGFTN
ncbi:BrnT family toxin [candidate division KSB1 bacterium]|nr:BrnT family toxin [candidate division KSB1 bacterium]